jgi:hypothetical protein
MVLNLKFHNKSMDDCEWKIDIVRNALYHYATILNKSVVEINVVQMGIEFVKANLITESYFAEELIEYIANNGTDIDTGPENTIFHYSKIRKTILNALDCYVDGLKNTIGIMTPNSADPHSDFYSMEQEIEMCTSLKNDIVNQYGNITHINGKSLF